MRTEFENTYIAKFNHPFAAYLNEQYAMADWGNCVDGPLYVAWYGGRHFMIENTQGFCSHVKSETRFDSSEDAGEWIANDYPEAFFEDEEGVD